LNRTDKKIIHDDAKKILQERFKELLNIVHLAVFTQEKHNSQYDVMTVAFLRELAKLSDKIVVHEHYLGDEEAKKYHVSRSPTILLNPDEYHLRYIGAPLGEEGRSFLESILMVSRKQSGLSQSSKKLLANLNDSRHIRVFVTLACPYCPMQVITAFKAAIENPRFISSECIDASEHLDLAEQFEVGAVPHTVINDKTISHGLEPEERFISEIITLQAIEPAHEEFKAKEPTLVDLIIIGAGPAGLTAGIYAARSGLKTIVLEKNIVGGQAAITPIVENWPGFSSIPGKQLMDMISKQAREYVTVLEGEQVKEIKVGKNIEAITERDWYLAKAIILATGSEHRKLNVPGENIFYGHGVSYCPTCDGFLFKDKNVVVVGGGNTAMTDALYLNSLGAQVIVLNRGEDFKGEQTLQDSMKREQISVKWYTIVEEILGDKSVTTVKVRNVKDNSVREIKAEGVFVAVGEVPNNQLATDVGLKIDEQGFVIVDRFGRTNIPRIYAAGDITGGVRQITTAVGAGATAATSTFEDLLHPYWIPKKN
jgi:thioredoxin reductase (NADPH)